MGIFGNLYGRDYFFYLYLYPLFMLTLQFSNFQSDYRNTMPLPQCCIEWYTKKMKTAFDGAVTEKKARNMIVREERQKQDKAERQTHNEAREERQQQGSSHTHSR